MLWPSLIIGLVVGLLVGVPSGGIAMMWFILNEEIEHEASTDVRPDRSEDHPGRHDAHGRWIGWDDRTPGGLW